MYQNYIFDLYGTLVDIHTNENKKYLWDKLALFYNFNGASYTSLELKREYKRYCKLEEEKMSDKDFPEINLLNVFKQLFLIKSVKVDKELAVQTGKIFRTLSIEYIRLYDGVITLLEELKKSEKKVYLLSNAQQVFTEPEMKMLQIYEYFDGIFFSSDLEYKKPSAKFYEALLERYHLDKNNSIMIGNDAIADMKGAYDVGISSLYIHSNLSPDIEGELKSDYAIMDGDVHKILKMIVK